MHSVYTSQAAGSYHVAQCDDVSATSTWSDLKPILEAVVHYDDMPELHAYMQAYSYSDHFPYDSPTGDSQSQWAYYRIYINVDSNGIFASLVSPQAGFVPLKTQFGALIFTDGLTEASTKLTLGTVDASGFQQVLFLGYPVYTYSDANNLPNFNVLDPVTPDYRSGTIGGLSASTPIVTMDTPQVTDLLCK